MKKSMFFIMATLLVTNIYGKMLNVEMKDLKTNETLGTIKITESKYGTVFTPNLKGLTPGAHGFHVHEKGDIGSAIINGKEVLGGASGGHYDPDKTGKHGEPWTLDNHRGDLPALYVNLDGTSTNPVLAPRLTIKEIKGRSLMIHFGGDNHSDHPKPLGGGGPRMAAGIIE